MSSSAADRDDPAEKRSCALVDERPPPILRKSLPPIRSGAARTGLLTSGAPEVFEYTAEVDNTGGDDTELSKIGRRERLKSAVRKVLRCRRRTEITHAGGSRARERSVADDIGDSEGRRASVEDFLSARVPVDQTTPDLATRSIPAGTTVQSLMMTRRKPLPPPLPQHAVPPINTDIIPTQSLALLPAPSPADIDDDCDEEDSDGEEEGETSLRSYLTSWLPSRRTALTMAGATALGVTALGLGWYLQRGRGADTADWLGSTSLSDFSRDLSKIAGTATPTSCETIGVPMAGAGVLPMKDISTQWTYSPDHLGAVKDW